jgi:hypothetical protein
VARAVQPLFAFQPIPNSPTGHESTGVNNLIFAPTGFPDGLNNGIFLGFHGSFEFAGTNNAKNPLVYADPTAVTYFHFIEGQQAGVGHLDGVLTTRDSLFIADLDTNGDLDNGTSAGVIYQIKSLVNPTPPILGLQSVGSQITLTWGRGTLQAANEGRVRGAMSRTPSVPTRPPPSRPTNSTACDTEDRSAAETLPGNGFGHSACHHTTTLAR